MKKILLRYIPISWQKKWYQLKNPGIIDEVEIAAKLLFKGDKHQTMLDVGAHFGESLEIFAKKKWNVFAFEPDPKNLIELIPLVKKYPNVTLEESAVGEQEISEMPYYSSNVSSGISGLLNFHSSHAEIKKVQVITLKNFCEKKKLQHISFLKSDTEGYDLPVLKGFNWNNPHPRVIVCEFDNLKSEKLNYSIKEQVQFLSDKGYKLLISEWYPIVEYGQVHQWKRFCLSATNVNPKAWGNIIAVKESDFNALILIAENYGKIEKE
ncbi:MAG: FkbM family methyltransferase [Flavobacteriales bacterium]|nr:FkbM family methyltransferase [Flavobacteriales bacterium]